jgi:hypothetical protein
MDTPSENAPRDVFLWKVAEQFEGLSKWVVLPNESDVWEDGKEAVFSVWQDDYEVLRFSASFDDEGARQKRLNQKLNLVGEWKGEATELLVLGWKDSAPDLDKGLDSAADHTEGEFAGAMGRVIDVNRPLSSIPRLSLCGLSRVPNVCRKQRMSAGPALRRRRSLTWSCCGML